MRPQVSTARCSGTGSALGTVQILGTHLQAPEAAWGKGEWGSEVQLSLEPESEAEAEDAGRPPSWGSVINLLWCLFVLDVLGVKSRALHILGVHSTPDPWPFTFCFEAKSF